MLHFAWFRLKNQLAENEKSFGWDWKIIRLRTFYCFPQWKETERWLKYPSFHNALYVNRLPYILKDEGCFFKTLGGSMQGMTDSGKIPFLPRQPPTVPSSLTKALHASAPAAYIYSCKAKGYGLTTIFASEVLLENIKSTAFWPILIIQNRFLIKNSCNSFLFYMFTGMNNKVISWKRLIYWYLYW